MKAFTKEIFINQEQKLGDQRWLYTILVSNINYADSVLAVVSNESASTAWEIKVFGLWWGYGRKAET